MHFPFLIPHLCLCLCVHLSLSLLGLYGELVWLFSPSLVQSPLFISCFGQLIRVRRRQLDGVCDAFYRIEGGGFFFCRGREDFRVFFSVKGGECSDVRLGFFVLCFFLRVCFLNVDGALKSRQICSFAAHACVLHLQQREHTRRAAAPAVRSRMMCTLPSEGVSFCLSAAAKSLLNKKADVKVSLLVSSLAFCILLFLTAPLTGLHPWTTFSLNISLKSTHI